MPCRSCPCPFLLIEELLDDGEVLFPVAHPGRVPGAAERVHPRLRVCSSKLGALLRRYDVLIRLEDEDAPRPVGEVAGLKPGALYEVDLKLVHAAQVLLGQARY